jgi:hypothetical protein
MVVRVVMHSQTMPKWGFWAAQMNTNWQLKTRLLWWSTEQTVMDLGSCFVSVWN